MKTERAQTHLNQLNRELDLFLNKPDAIIRKRYAKDSRYICRTEFSGMPKVIGMLLGEFLYCLRSGLDQLAWHLALTASRNYENSARRICFPIFETIAAPQDKRNWKKVIRLFPDDVAAVIEELQPFKGSSSPKGHALWQLNALCNIDKHRIIPVHSQSGNIFVPANPAALVRYVDDGDAIEVSVPLADAAQLQFNPEPGMTIEFGEWGSDFVIPRNRLAEIHDFVRDDVIPKFARFVAKSPEIPVMRIANISTVYNG